MEGLVEGGGEGRGGEGEREGEGRWKGREMCYLLVAVIHSVPRGAVLSRPGLSLTNFHKL